MNQIPPYLRRVQNDIIGQPDDSFYLYFEIEPVVLIYGNSRRLNADQHNHAGRLMKTLDWLGRERIALRSVISGRVVLTRSSIRALNLYLKHGRGLSAFRRVAPWSFVRHRHGWEALQELLNLRWTH